MENEKKHKIVIVDDECIIADTLNLIFSANGYDARAAYSAEEVLEILVEWQPDIALIDVILPVMNGIELAMFMRTNHPSCHILLISGQATTRDLLAEAEKKGHTFDLLAKPTHPTELLERALKLLSGDRQMNCCSSNPTTEN